MEYDYCFGNNCYNYYSEKGVKSTFYNVLAKGQLQVNKPGIMG